MQEDLTRLFGDLARQAELYNYERTSLRTAYSAAINNVVRWFSATVDENENEAWAIRHAESERAALGQILDRVVQERRTALSGRDAIVGRNAVRQYRRSQGEAGVEADEEVPGPRVSTSAMRGARGPPILSLGDEEDEEFRRAMEESREAERKRREDSEQERRDKNAGEGGSKGAGGR